MSKTLCKTKDPEKLAEKQEKPRYKCGKCGREARKEKHVCKPSRIGK